MSRIYADKRRKWSKISADDHDFLYDKYTECIKNFSMIVLKRLQKINKQSTFPNIQNKC